MPLEITAQEKAHDFARMGTAPDIRRRMWKAPPAPARVIPRDPDPKRHPLDAKIYLSPLPFPKYAPYSRAQFGGDNWPKTSVKAIIASVAADAGVSPDAILSSSRIKALVTPRQMAAWSIHTSPYLRRQSLSQIGSALGGRDHSTALYAIRKVQRFIDAGLVDPKDPSTWARLVARQAGGGASK
jgi:hypothetical protein